MDLSGKLLIAMPGMGDPRFEKSVIYMCAHSEDGAMGLIVNKPAPDIVFGDLLEQLGITATLNVEKPIYLGGPVEHGRGFVLHSGDYGPSGTTLRVDRNFGMTATMDILEDIANGRGPGFSMLALGYSGWGPGQLEEEILRNGWLTCDANHGLVFEAEDEAKWDAALKALGIDPLLLSGSAGHA